MAQQPHTPSNSSPAGHHAAHPMVTARGEELDVLHVAQAVELARHDVNTSQSQAERSVKNAMGLLVAVTGIGAAAGYLAPYAMADPPGIVGWINVGLFVLLYVITFANTVWTIRSDIKRRLEPDAPGWLGLLANHRCGLLDEPGDLRQYYLDRAKDAITSYGSEALEVGDVAYRKHRRNQSTTQLVFAVLAHGAVTFGLLKFGW